MKCPFCGSERVYARKRGYSWLIGCLGVLVLSLFGLLLGFIGRDKLRYHCNDCGQEWIV